jgi:hypothetical protein
VEKTSQRGVVYSLLHTKYYTGDQIKKTKMSRACSTYGGETDIGSGWRNLREEYHLEVSGVDGRIILKCIKKWDGGGVDWIDVAQDRGK